MSDSSKSDNSGFSISPIGIGLMALVVVMGVFFGTWFLYSNMSVWSARMNGESILAEATYSRQVRIQEATAKNAAAELEGQAELTKANYAAKANATMAAGLGGPEGYLRYMYIRMLEEQGANSKQIIYIPTEAGMPILEAGKR